MIIAVTSTGPTEDSPVDKRFGRAPYFIFYDTEGREYRMVDNSTAAGETQGAGISAGEKVFKQGANTVITFHVGPKAFRVLKAASIDVVTIKKDMTVKEAVRRFVDGQLTGLQGPDVPGHWT